MPRVARSSAAIATGVMLVVGATYLVAAGQKPEKNQGMDEARLQQFPVAAHISTMPGYELRGRRIAMAPGGTAVEHSHADRPGFVYILEGSMTEHRGDVARVVKVGDSWHEDANTVHWMENTTDKPCVFLAVDLVKK